MLSILSCYSDINANKIRISLVNTKPNGLEFNLLQSFAQQNACTITTQNQEPLPSQGEMCKLYNLEFENDNQFSVRFTSLQRLMDEINSAPLVAQLSQELPQSSMSNSSSISYSDETIEEAKVFFDFIHQKKNPLRDNASGDKTKAPDTTEQTKLPSSNKRERPKPQRNKQKDRARQHKKVAEVRDLYAEIHQLLVSDPSSQLPRVKILQLLVTTIQEYAAKITELRKKFNELDTLRQHLKVEIEAQRDKIEAQKHTKRTSRIEQLKEQISEKDSKILMLRAELDAQRKTTVTPNSTSTAPLPLRSPSRHSFSLFRQGPSIGDSASSASHDNVVGKFQKI